MLEALQHEYSAFVTLTYDDANLPKNGRGLDTLDPGGVGKWLKRIREKVSPLRLRYYLVGEYGDVTWRPHYHLALFGYPTCEFGRSRYSVARRNCCEACDTIRDSWGLGLVDLGSLELKSAAYIAGYVTKKLTGPKDVRLEGRYPEFARMSLRPGIGGDALWEVADTLLAFGLETEPDVPAALRHGDKILPLGKYLRRRLRTFVGKEEGAPQETIDQAQEELRELREVAWKAPQGQRGVTLKALAVSAGDAGYARIEAREKIYRKRGSI